jgi:hypothetical protein
MKRILYFLPLAGLFLNSCKPNLEEVSPFAGNLDFSKYVAVGDYITAGYTNGGLNQESQKYAYPNIIAQQFATVGGPVTFAQPEFPGGSQMIVLDNINNGTPTFSNTEDMYTFLSSACTPPTAANTFPRYAGNSDALQNLGVPGLSVLQFLRPGLGNEANKGNAANFNPYFERMLPAGDNRTYMRLANKSQPTFFTCWFGMADVVNYAMSGASCGTLPTTAQFQSLMTSMIDSLSAKGTKPGVVANIPSFQYLGFARIKSLELQDKLQKQTNNSNLKIWVKVLKIYNSPANGYDTTPITDKDYITPAGLAALGKNGHGLSEADPLTEKEVLDQKEADFLESRISVSKPNYNAIIDTLLNGKTSKYRNKVVMTNMQQLYGTLANGVIYNGVKYDLKPVTGGFYSFDYFSPTSRGQAIIANKFIQTINERFATKIFEVNVNDYPSYKLP